MNSWLIELFNQASKHEFVYLIEMRKNSSKWFFVDFVEHNNNATQIIWTPRQKDASMFLTEQKVEEFKAEYISPRKVSIIRLDKPDVSMLFLTGG